MTAGNDTVDGTTTPDSISGDTIIDSSTTDADVMNLQITSSPATAPVIANIETINLDDKFGVSNFTATSVTAGKLNVNSTVGSAAKVTGVDGSKGLSVGVGANLTSITIDDVQKNASITAGTKLSTLYIDGAATFGTTDDAATVVLAGRALTIDQSATGGSVFVGNLTLDSKTAANTVTTGAGVGAAEVKKVVITGDQNLTLTSTGTVMSGVTVTDSAAASVTTTTKLTASAANMDLSKIATDKIELSAITTTHEGTFANNANVVLSYNAVGTVLDVKAASGATTINIAAGGTGAGAFGITDDAASYFKTYNITTNQTTKTEVDAVLDRDGTTFADINVAGTGDIEFAATTKAAKIVSTGSGALTVTTDTGTVTNVTGGTGNDVFKVTGAVATTIDGGQGSDKIIATTSGDLSTVTFSNVESIDMNGLATTANGSALNGNSYVILNTGGGGNDDLTVNIDVTTVDLGKLAINTNDFTTGKFVVNGGALSLSLNVTGTSIADALSGGTGNDVFSGGNGADTIVGGGGTDNITGGNGADSITGGDGQDSIVLTEASAAVDKVVLATAAVDRDVIVGFNAGAVNGDALKIALTGNNVALAADAASTLQTASTSGNLTLAGGAQVVAITVENVSTFSTDGTSVLDALVTGTGSGTITAQNAADTLVFLVSNGTDVGVYYGVASGVTADTAVTANEIALVGTLSATTLANLVGGNVIGA